MRSHVQKKQPQSRKTSVDICFSDGKILITLKNPNRNDLRIFNHLKNCVIQALERVVIRNDQYNELDLKIKDLNNLKTSFSFPTTNSNSNLPFIHDLLKELEGFYYSWSRRVPPKTMRDGNYAVELEQLKSELLKLQPPLPLTPAATVPSVNCSEPPSVKIPKRLSDASTQTDSSDASNVLSIPQPRDDIEETWMPLPPLPQERPTIECREPPKGVSQLLVNLASSVPQAVHSPTAAAAGPVSVPDNRGSFPGKQNESFSDGFGPPIRQPLMQPPIEKQILFTDKILALPNMRQDAINHAYAVCAMNKNIGLYGFAARDLNDQICLVLEDDGNVKFLDLACKTESIPPEQLDCTPKNGGTVAKDLYDNRQMIIDSVMVKNLSVDLRLPDKHAADYSELLLPIRFFHRNNSDPVELPEPHPQTGVTSGA